MIEEAIQKRAEELQQECQKFIESVEIKKKYDYQDLVNIWMFRKLAELQLNLK